jgi:pyrimidine operon attenuation protein/uracil phosphoribosyltransferase
MAKTMLVRDSAQAAGSQQAFQAGAAVANLNLGTLVLIADVITAIGTIQTQVNALLAQLRAQGVIAP